MHLMKPGDWSSLTVAGDCAACMVLMGEPLMPDRMVTHSWSNLFACLVAAVPELRGRA